MCGADPLTWMDPESFRGSPPRVRSRPNRAAAAKRRPRITSACAEQTNGKTVTVSAPGDHLRVCGADDACSSVACMKAGSPPRVRSRLHTVEVTIEFRGITSACAEQTLSPIGGFGFVGDHLRVCGADS